jgi:hypothetical protein
VARRRARTFQADTTDLSFGSPPAWQSALREYRERQRIVMPDAWTGGAPITFQLSVDGTNYHDLHHVDPSTFFPFEVSVPRPVPGSVLTLPADFGTAVPFVKVRSGTSALPVAQTAD